MAENQAEGPEESAEMAESAAPEARKARFRVSWLGPFISYAWHRFGEDRCTSMASSLSYTSLLAIVPLTAIAFAMLAAFPVFEGVREQFQEMMFANFLPQSAEAMQEYLDQFVANTGQLTAVGIIGLALTAILLLGTIESNLNGIFRVAKPRAMVPRLLVFWALITLGPLLMGASFSLSTYVFAATQWVGVDEATLSFIGFAKIMPALMVMAALWVFYVIIPNRPVGFIDAVLGAVVAGLMFAGLRKVFGFYVANFPTYQTIYGAVSVIPIFLIWMYLSWLVVLFGAEMTAALGEWRSAGGRPMDQSLRSGRRLAVALNVLAKLLQASHRGDSVSRSQLLEGTGIAEQTLERQVGWLRGSGYVEQTADGNWVVSRDLGEVTLFDLMQSLELELKFTEEWALQDGTVEPWERRMMDITRANSEAQQELMGMSLKALLSDAVEEAGEA